jgi:hypothetical protein
VENQFLDGRIGYLKVRGFHETTLQEMERSLQRLGSRRWKD